MEIHTPQDEQAHHKVVAPTASTPAAITENILMYQQPRTATNAADRDLHDTAQQGPIGGFATSATALRPSARRTNVSQQIEHDRPGAGKCWVSVHGKRYLMPNELVGRTVQILHDGDHLVFVHLGRIVASHSVQAGSAQLRARPSDGQPTIASPRLTADPSALSTEPASHGRTNGCGD